jgi:hypothetical protein
MMAIYFDESGVCCLILMEFSSWEEWEHFEVLALMTEMST